MSKKSTLKPLDLESTIMEKVRSNEIAMKPRWYFVVGSIMTLIGLTASTVAAIFLINVTLFLLREHGPRGEWRLQQMLESFPLWIPVLAVAGIAVGVWLVRKYDFSYRYNFGLIAVGFIVAVVSSAFILDYTGLSDIWFRQGPMKGMYRQNQKSDAPIPRGRGFGRQQNVQPTSTGTSRGQNAQSNRQNCLADDCLMVADLEYPAGELPAPVQQALNMAVEDERKALSFYEAVIAQFGMVRPFSMIKGAEEQHLSSLQSIYDKYGLQMPAVQPASTITVPTTLKAACQIGVDAEIANAQLYRDELLPAVSDYADITLVFTNLMNASEQKHLPAFERCN